MKKLLIALVMAGVLVSMGTAAQAKDKSKTITCPTGQYLSSGKCKACPSGYVCFDDKRKKCPAGTYAQEGAICQPCTEETYSSAGATSCKSCPKGKISNANHTKCIVERAQGNTSGPTKI